MMNSLGLYFNWLDVVLAAILVLMIGRSLWTGFSRSVSSLIGLLLGFWIAVRHFASLSQRLSPWMENELARSLLAFFLLFVMVYLSLVVTGILIRGIFHAVRLGWLDRVLGGLVGLVKGLVLAGVIIFLLTLLLPPKSPVLGESFLYPKLSRIAQTMIVMVPADLKGRFMWKWRRVDPHGPQTRREEI
jgi:membrane protein required for colicin V production